MKHKYLATILTLTALIPQGCSHKIYPHTTQTTQTTETITEIIRDTIIQTQPDTAILQALIRCDSTGRARLEEINTLKQTHAQHLHQTLTITPDPQPHQPTPITLTTTIDSIGIYLTYKERHHQTTQTQTTETIIEKQVNILHWWQKALMWIGILTILWKTLKKLLKIKNSV